MARSPLSLRPGHRQSAFVPPTCLDLAQPATQRGRPHCGGRETRPRGRRLPAEPRLAAERRPAPRLGVSRSVRPGSGAPLVTSPVAVTKPVSFLVLMSSQPCLLPRLPPGGSPPASARSPVPSVCPPSSSWLPELQSGLCGSPAPVAWQDSQSPTRLSARSARPLARGWLLTSLPVCAWGLRPATVRPEPRTGLVGPEPEASLCRPHLVSGRGPEPAFSQERELNATLWLLWGLSRLSPRCLSETVLLFEGLCATLTTSSGGI